MLVDDLMGLVQGVTVEEIFDARGDELVLTLSFPEDVDPAEQRRGLDGARLEALLKSCAS